MFLKEFYTYRPKGAILLVAFIIVFVFLNIKWGAVAFPINVYGMYSGKYPLQDTQWVYKIKTGESFVDFTSLSMAERDKLQYSLDFYGKYKSNNVIVFNTMKRVLSTLIIGKLMEEEKYTPVADSIQYARWFNHLLSDILNKEIHSCEIYTQSYVWQMNQLNPVATPQKKYQFVSEP
ncbi:MAG: hypothetical protein WCJ85_11245 [Chitinophagaceae bacterium]